MRVAGSRGVMAQIQNRYHFRHFGRPDWRVMARPGIGSAKAI
jgi:hypothetical protein